MHDAESAFESAIWPHEGNIQYSHALRLGVNNATDETKEGLFITKPCLVKTFDKAWLLKRLE